jgi:hypothetical protein
VKTLAQVVVFLMEQLTTAEGPGIDWQACGDLCNDTWLQLAGASPVERQALAEAAAARLAELLREPDEYGYTPRALVTPAHREFLQCLADGSAWQEFDAPESEGAGPDAAAERPRE